MNGKVGEKTSKAACSRRVAVLFAYNIVQVQERHFSFSNTAAACQFAAFEAICVCNGVYLMSKF